MQTPYHTELPKGELEILSVCGQTRLNILLKYIILILPQVKKLLRYWEAEAKKCKDPELRRQALASLDKKAFHCQGGAVYAVNCQQLSYITLRLIVAYQTICDYLDNLCDRAGSTDEKAFTQLHRAFIDALTPDSNINDYYAYYPYRDDSGYLVKLVNECRSCIKQLPSYQEVYNDICKLAGWYSDLQVKKHLDPDIREQVLFQWARQHLIDYPEVLWQEFAAATGSTLAIFALFTLAANGMTDEIHRRKVIKAYFPWICGLHILLDYFIDQQEDREGGDLNFTFYYSNEAEMMQRLLIFVQNARNNAIRLPTAVFENLIVEGLLAMYLSDKKVMDQELEQQAQLLIKEAGPGTRKVLNLCHIVRKTLLVN